jgi:hypothetical protein
VKDNQAPLSIQKKLVSIDGGQILKPFYRQQTNEEIFIWTLSAAHIGKDFMHVMDRVVKWL